MDFLLLQEFGYQFQSAGGDQEPGETGQFDETVFVRQQNIENSTFEHAHQYHHVGIG